MQSGGRDVVEQEAHIHEAQQPKVGRRTSPVKNGVGNGLQSLIPVLAWILVLLVWLTLPIRESQGMKAIFEFVTDLNLGTVTDEFGRVLTNCLSVFIPSTWVTY
jgi:hypothetical protein